MVLKRNHIIKYNLRVVEYSDNLGSTLKFPILWGVGDNLD